MRRLHNDSNYLGVIDGYHQRLKMTLIISIACGYVPHKKLYKVLVSI